jgi:hypothetical protein
LFDALDETVASYGVSGGGVERRHCLGGLFFFLNFLLGNCLEHLRFLLAAFNFYTSEQIAFPWGVETNPRMIRIALFLYLLLGTIIDPCIFIHIHNELDGSHFDVLLPGSERWRHDIAIFLSLDVVVQKEKVLFDFCCKTNLLFQFQQLRLG